MPKAIPKSYSFEEGRVSVAKFPAIKNELAKKINYEIYVKFKV